MIVDCKYVKLEDIATDSADGPFGSNLKKEHYTDKPEVRIIQLSNIKDDGWCEDNTKYTTFEHLKNISRSEVHPGDIVIAKMMPAGRAILCPSHESKFVLSSDAVRFSLKKEIYNSYVVYALNSPYFRNQVYENVTGIGRVRTSLTKLRKYQIPLPPLPEQQRIVEHLDSAFAKIDALKANAEKMVEEAKALFASALREAMAPKEGWEEKILGEVCQRISDGSHNPPKGEISSPYKMLSSKNVRADKFTFDNPRYLSENDFNKENQRTNVEKGDVLLTIVGAGLGDCCQFPCEEKVVFQRSVAVIKTEKHILDSRYLMYYLQNEYDNLTQESNGAAQKGIYLNQLKRYGVSLPPLSDQQRIVAHLDDLSAKVRQLEANYKKACEECNALKQAILRETFE